MDGEETWGDDTRGDETWADRTWGDEDLLPPLRGDDGPAAEASITRVDRWRRGTASGAILTAVALGLREVFDPPEDDETAEVVDASAGEGDTDRLQLRFDPDDPRGTSVTVRRPPQP